MTIITYDLVVRMMAALNTDLLFDSATLHLFANDITPTPATVLADLLEADYTGYSEEIMEPPGSIYVASGGEIIVQYPHRVFQPSGSALTNVVYGFWVEGTFGGTGIRLGWATRLAEPVPMVDVTSIVVVEPRLVFAQPTVDG